MKKLFSLVIALTLTLGLVSLAGAEGETFELALITDIGTIDDKSFNQGSWEGLEQYAVEHGLTYKYYQPAEQSDIAYLDSIQIAVDAGAKLVVTPGFLFEVPIFTAQQMYPDVYFVLVDGVPNDGDWGTGPEYLTADNAVGVLYAEEQSGFLAGYAAVKEGYTKLGFMGGMAVPAVVRFGHGFVQGADHAAQELGIDGIAINYHYTGGFAATPEAQAMAASWYNDGVEVIFACGGAVGNSVMTAAEAAGQWVIGVDVDQSAESETVITSAMKGLQSSVYQAVDGFYTGGDAFPGGQNWVLSAAREGVSLPMESSKFTVFTQADYDAIFAALVDGAVVVNDDIGISADQL
ncbi:MAG: BMP family ABC transporter substrate-binding protein, partial [Clostridia bacterium]|nr:BMP family ABC transporter substrate-binding protein [Clostridia bacterium]